MRFIDFSGTIGKSRQSRTGQDNIQPSDLDNKPRLLTIIKGIFTRLSFLESKQEQTEPVEFEINFTTASAPTVLFRHGISGPIRWYITSLQVNSPPAATPALVAFSTSFDVDGQTSLKWSASATVTGRAVVRFESSPYGIRRPG